MNNHSTNWEEYQTFAIENWHSNNEYSLKNNQDTLDDLITSSKPLIVNDFNIKTDLIYGIDLDITFDADGRKSELWIAESVNYVPSIFRFLEAIILSKAKEQFYFCEEEGPETYLYVSQENEDTIRFIHISERAQFAEYIKTEDYKIRQDIIIDKKELVKIFYVSIMNAINNVDIKELKEEWWYQLEEYEILKNGSGLIEQYLEVNQ